MHFAAGDAQSPTLPSFALCSQSQTKFTASQAREAYGMHNCEANAGRPSFRPLFAVASVGALLLLAPLRSVSVRGLGFIYSYSSSTRGWRLLRPAHGRTDDDDDNDNDSACSQTYQPTRRARGRESLWEVQYDENWGKVSSPPILLDTSAAMPLHWLFRQSCNARNATLFVFLTVTVQVMN